MLSGDFARRRLARAGWVPFYAYYQNPEIKAATDFLSKMCVAAPVGMAAMWLARVRGGRSTGCDGCCLASWR